MTQNAKIMSCDGETLELSFDNRSAMDAYLSTGIDELLLAVLHDDLNLPWKVKASVALRPELAADNKSTVTERRRHPGEWPIHPASRSERPKSSLTQESQPNPISWPPVRKPPPPENFQRIQELWPKVLDETKRRRRFLWVLLSQNSRLVGTAGKSILLGFTNEQSRLAYLSSGVDKLLEDVATEILRYNCKIETVLISE